MKHGKRYAQCTITALLVTGLVLCTAFLVNTHMLDRVNDHISGGGSEREALSKWYVTAVLTCAYAWRIWPLTAVITFAFTFAECHSVLQWLHRRSQKDRVESPNGVA